MARLRRRGPGLTRGPRAQGRLEEAFGALPVWLAAENGVFIRPPGDAWVTLLQARRGAPAHAAHVLSRPAPRRQASALLPAR